MRETQERFGKLGGVLGYHIILSFKPGEVTPEEAFACGSEFVRRNLAQKYEVVLAEHINCEHLHCHIVFNSVSFIDGKKFRNSFKDYFGDIRGLADSICRKHGLSVINPQNKGLHYAEWKAQKSGKPTIRGQVRTELDEIIKISYTVKDFWRILKERGYTVHRKGENIKYTSVIPPYGKKPLRLNNLGADYTEEAITERIRANRNGIKTVSTAASPKRYRVRNLKTAKRKKLSGFVALYFRYLYLFKKIRRKQTPQRVSFFMREELTKFERYKKQFLFLFAHDIETPQQLAVYQKSREDEISERVLRRKNLYKESENCEETKAKAAQINAELSALRREARLCKAIFEDAARIAEKKHQAEELEKDKEMKGCEKNKHEQQRS